MATTNEQPAHLEPRLRNVPTQARSRDRLRRVLAAADELLAAEGAGAFTTTRVAQAAGIPVGSFYHYFRDKAAIAEALAVDYWREFAGLVAAVAARDTHDPLPDPGGTVLDELAGAFRSHPGFLALWYGGLRSERIRDATRPIRTEIGRSIEHILATHWPAASASARAAVARMIVIVGDGLLREAFRLRPDGDPELLAESKLILDAYIRARLERESR